MNSAALFGQIISPPELRYTEDNQLPIATTLFQFEQMGTGGEPVMATVQLKAWGKNSSELLMETSAGQKVVVSGSLRLNKVDRPEGFKETRAEIWMNNLVVVQ